MNMESIIFEYHFDTNIKSILCNLTFHSYTSQFDRQYVMYVSNNTLMTLSFTILIKHAMAYQSLQVFNIEEIK